MGLREPRLNTDHRVMLSVIRGERVTRNKSYRRGITRWPIWRITRRPHPELKAAFKDLKYAVYKAPWPTTTRSDWILAETWRLSDMRTSLRRTAQASNIEVRQETRELQNSLQAD